MNITGTNKKNTLKGTNGDDVISGLGGNDILKGKGGNDTLLGGNGNDKLFGDGGDNIFNGGAGNDKYILTGSFEEVETGLGNDLIDLSGFTPGEGGVTIKSHAAAKGMFAVIDGEEDYGFIRIDNGAGPAGFLSFTDLNNGLQLDDSKPLGGMGLYGTAFDDEFMIDTGARGWIQITTGAGNDLIRIEGTTGTVRLDYSDQSAGIHANLKFGFVFQTAGSGSMDRILGDGRVKEIRGTDFDDIIHGSRGDDRFILRQGDDIVSGGAGSDTVRYDRSGVDAVSVNLGTKKATGVWNGEAFTDKLKNIENVRGSRDGDDTLIGNDKDNYFDGKGGNDTLQGKGGNDNLRGNSGSDIFIFKSGDGFDTIQDFDALDSAEKINLKGVAAIADFNDLMANFISTSGPNTIINDGAGLTITLWNVSVADLDSSDFIF